MLLTEKREGAKPQTSTLTNKTHLSAPRSFFLGVLFPHLLSLDGTVSPSVFRKHLVGGIRKISADTKSLALLFLLQMKDILNQEATSSEVLQGTRGVSERGSHLWAGTEHPLLSRAM